MTLHNKPEFNTPEIISAMKYHGMDIENPSMLADAFRLGYISALPDWEKQRCAECTCEHGGADCDWIKRGT